MGSPSLQAALTASSDSPLLAMAPRSDWMTVQVPENTSVLPSGAPRECQRNAEAFWVKRS